MQQATSAESELSLRRADDRDGEAASSANEDAADDRHDELDGDEGTAGPLRIPRTIPRSPRFHAGRLARAGPDQSMVRMFPPCGRADHVMVVGRSSEIFAFEEERAAGKFSGE